MERPQEDVLRNSRQAYVNLTLATFAFAVAFAAWSLISPEATQIKKNLSLDDFQRAVLIAVPVILGSLARIPMGILTDRFGGRRVFTALLLFTLIPIAFLGIANSFWTYVLTALFLGMAGASFAVGVPFVSRWFSPDKQGMALGIYGIGNIGTAVAAFTVPSLVTWFDGLRGAYWIYLIPVALMAGIFWLFARDFPGLVKPKSLSDSMQVIRTEKLSWIFSLFYFLTFGGFVAIANYLPSLLRDWFPTMSAQEAGAKAAGFAVVATLSRPIGGWLSDKLGGQNVLVWVFTAGPIGALALAWLSTNPTMEGATALFLVTAVGLGLGNGAVFKLVALYFPKNTGLVTGVVGCMGGLGGFFPPLVMGQIGEVVGFVLLAVFAVACLAILYQMRRSAPTSRPATT